MTKLKILFVGAIISAIALFGVYRWGYNASEEKHQAIIEEQKRKIEELGKQEVKIEKEVVTIYKDRIKVVKQIEKEIVEVIPDVLKDESAQCVIGPNFIRLHNHSATNTPLPRTP